MNSRADFFFQTSANLLVGVGFATLALTGEVDAPSTLCFVLTYTAYFYLNSKQRAERLSPRLVSLFSKLYVFVFVLDLWWLSKSFISAAIHLLIFIQILKFFSGKKDRDYFYFILIAFMELLVGASLTISPAFFFAFLVFLVLVISTLVSFEIKRSQSILPGSKPSVQPAQVAAQRVNDREGRQFYRTLIAASITLSLGIVALASVIFFTLPRVEGGFFSRARAPTQSITGFSSTVQFGDVGSIKKNMSVVMRVQIEGDPQDFEGVKWRGIAINKFEGNAWYRVLGENERPLTRNSAENYRVPPDRLPPPHRFVRYRAVLEPLSTEVLFVAARARTIQTKARVRIDPGDSLTTDFHPNTRIQYEVISDIATPAPPALRLAPSNYPDDIVKDYLQLPPLDSRIQLLARAMARSADNNFDRARGLEKYLRENFGYTLDLPSVQERDPISQFLFETKRGHCEYFASSMAILLRFMGIPSRVVNGFQTGEYNSVAKDFIVREADAHSWVEAYFPGHGWVVFDPTPSLGPAQPATAWLTLNHYLDALELFWINWIVGFDSFRQVTLFQDAQREALYAKQQAERLWMLFTRRLSVLLRETIFTSKPSQSRMRGRLFLGKFVFGSLLIFLSTTIFAVLFYGIRRRRAFRSPQAHHVSEAYAQWLRFLSQRGFFRRASQTPLEFSLSITDPALRLVAVEMTRVYNSLRFSGRPLGPQDYQSLRSRLRLTMKSL